MKYKAFLFTTLMLMCIAYSVEAADRWSLELRGGADFATRDLGDADLSTGYGFEGTVAFRFIPFLAAYAGWSWNHFSAEQSFAGSDVDFEETGYTFGLQFSHPLGESKLDYLIRAGGIFNHIEVENDSGDIIADSGHGLGWQIEAGLTVPLGQRWRFVPSVRYRSLSRDIEVNSVNTSVNLSYLSTGVGLWLIF
jgi:hypothetical protein